MDRPSLFQQNNIVHEFVGKKEVIEMASNKSFVYIYHPDCPFCKKSVPEWEKFTSDFAKNFKGSALKIGAINVSLHENRQKPQAGEKTGKFLNAIGEIKTVPTIKLFQNGVEMKYDSDKYPRNVQNFYNFLK